MPEFESRPRWLCTGIDAANTDRDTRRKAKGPWPRSNHQPAIRDRHENALTNPKIGRGQGNSTLPADLRCESLFTHAVPFHFRLAQPQAPHQLLVSLYFHLAFVLLDVLCCWPSCLTYLRMPSMTRSGYASRHYRVGYPTCQ